MGAQITHQTYFDHAATSPLRIEAREAMLDAFARYGNPAAVHRSGRMARAALEDARESIAVDLGARPEEIVFTSGGSEADTIALLGVSRPARPRVLISGIEHPAVSGAARHGRAEVVAVTRTGTVDTSALAELVDDRVGLVSVMAVNHETGIVQPLREVTRLAVGAGAWVHSDAVQALGKMPIRFGESGIDLMTVSAHKVGGPVGIGALIVRKGIQLTPTGLGGGQERQIRSGTQSVALAAGFAAAVRASVSGMAAENARIRALSADLCAILSGIGGMELNTIGECVPQIVNAGFHRIRADDLLMLLDRAGIDVSAGSACRAGVHRPSDVLLAMGRNEESAASALRFSLGYTTTSADIDHLARVLPDAVRAARVAFTE